MKVIQEGKGFVGTEHYVLDLDNEPVIINFDKQIDDLLISSPQKDVLISWDVNEWNDKECLLIKTFDNLKEINNLRCTKLLLKSSETLKDGETIKVFATIQRN